ncbi:MULTISPECIES: preprotein translocase subunit SecE [unclassified Breznakia]|uniref:preprotein translocase subunit SecE n=1 Tax=unclassified Breznakia TaxID=2623764 RepID=UPI0024759BC1|nr:MULTISPECIES: preprotein translocase subunit SecE [unclassified Breznakia]MDH6366482.1 preprotein translocase subunit SecE [Breznakia sp. PH1-1]MDH6403575.1 preprotein translocase subunit SecE [Breznakia sp. PF1-11]MDH6411284.1 preprotein translocase subunit SecE [Breznakia sp. PFB1-11]MDH6413740.1 preprotein translocase subunit SecE [Breznakia sp. PFB1-14]MDH6415829.1 preprotein translocase subunit SecE [Breznakia sp. PFB1-4]
MLKWFSIRGIITEIKRIRWSSPKELAKDSATVIIFTAAFALFFLACTAFNAWFLTDLLGV